MDREVCLYDGTKTRIICEDAALVDTLNRLMIVPFQEALNKAWLTKNPAEVRAKNYLAYVACLMTTKPSQNGILGEKATRRIRAHEIPVQDVESYSGKPDALVSIPKSKLGITKFAKIEALKKCHPLATLTWARMDTEGFVEHQGEQYQFDDEHYSPVVKRGFGDYYQFDRVLILDSFELQFFDQNIKRIFPKQAPAAIASI